MKKYFKSVTHLVSAALLTVLFASGSAMAQLNEGDVVFPEPPDETINLGDGRTLYKYSATVVSARGNRLTVRYPHGTTYTYDVSPEFRVEIDGRKLRVRELQRGDTLTAYVTAHETADHEIVYYEPTTQSVVETDTPEPIADTLPTTASPLPLIGLLGALGVSLGGLGLALRRRLG
jgi:hypothetical protein